MTKELTQLHIQAAQMVAKGVTDTEIAESLGRSRRWIQSQKRLPEFIELVEEFTKTYKQAAIEQNHRNLTEEVRFSRERTRKICNKLFSLCDNLAEKITERLKELDPDDLKASQLSQGIKQLTDSYQSAFHIETESFGLQRVIEELEKIRKLGAFD